MNKNQAGKGDKRRQEDYQRFVKNFESINWTKAEKRWVKKEGKVTEDSLKNQSLISYQKR